MVIYTIPFFIPAIKTLVLLVMFLVLNFINKSFVKPTVRKFLLKSGDIIGLETRIVTLSSVVENILSVLLFSVILMMVMDVWGISIAPILTGAGVIGLAVGFGAQTLVKDVVTGFFIILENQYNVGDYVKTAGVTGEVISINLRTTVIKSDNDVTHLIPNSQITTVTKGTKENIIIG